MAAPASTAQSCASDVVIVTTLCYSVLCSLLYSKIMSIHLLSHIYTTTYTVEKSLVFTKNSR